MSYHVPRKRERREYMWRGTCLGNTSVSYTNPPIITRWPRSRDLDYQIHSCEDQTHPGPPYKCGGPCNIWKKTLFPLELGNYDCQVVNSSNGSNIYHDWGTWHPMEGLAALTDPAGWGTTWGDGSSNGATGWNKFKPGKPGAQLSVFLAELRDFPRMFQFKVRRFKDIGKQYLNYQFGWRPFLRDLSNFLDTTQKMAKTLQYFRNNNGKPVRRGGTVRVSEESTSNEYSGAHVDNVGLNTWYFVGSVPTFRYRKVVYNYQRVWFDAVFQFWIPNIDTPEWISSVKRRMFGFNITPSVIWELVPWSWLIDWFSNVGDIMSNLSGPDSADNLVARYAYLMTHTIQRVTYSNLTPFQLYAKRQGLSSVGSKFTPQISDWYIQWERKQRIEANPYGFGLSLPDLTARQLAILAALGITRLT